MEKEYRVFRDDEPAARAAAVRLATKEFDVTPAQVTILGTARLEDGGGPIGWLVRVRIG